MRELVALWGNRSGAAILAMTSVSENGPAGTPPGGSDGSERLSRRGPNRRRAVVQTVGILNIDKPRGLTSHDVVDRVRGLCRQRRVGHAGTLDPLATGVLVVCLGRAARLTEYIVHGTKSYRATIRFGIVTDTWDAEGQVVETRDCGGLSLPAIESALAGFEGTIEQVPPMYSALKRDGQPLYHLARQGITVARKPRLVEIRSLRTVSWACPQLILEIECSRGTYIRSLAHDLGQALGVGAHLSGLTRLAVGVFRLEDAVSLRALLDEGSNDRWTRHLLPMASAVGHLPGVNVDLATAERICHGRGVQLSAPEDAQVCCAYAGWAASGERHLLAVLRRDREAGLWRPRKVLASPSDLATLG